MSELKSTNWLRDVPLAALEDKPRKDLLTALIETQRINPAVEVRTNTVFSRYVKEGGIMQPEEVQELREAMRKLKELRGKAEEDRLAIRLINATELGGGVAEMRPDSVALLRDLKCDAEWLVIDGCGPYYDVTVHIHEGIQNPDYSPLSQAEVEIMHLVAIHNFTRLWNFFASADAIWVDDPQPLGMIPLIRAFFPDVLVQWRCHVHVDPEASIRSYIADMVEGRLDKTRDALMLKFLEFNGITDGLKPANLRAHISIFHRDNFGAGLKLQTVPVHIMGPAINPLSFKNMPINKELVKATLAKYGIIANLADPIPPIVTEVSRYDPYKGPFEVVTSFIEGLKDCKDPNIRRSARFIYAASTPGDNPSGARLLRLLQEYLDQYPLTGLPQEMQNIRHRVFLLVLSDTSREESLMARITKAQPMTDHQRSRIYDEIMQMVTYSTRQMIQELLYFDMITESTADTLLAQEDYNAEFINFSEAQWDATYKLMRDAKRTLVTQNRAKNKCYTGREMNHLEVNAFVTASPVRVQFSSKEGFGLTVSEAMYKCVEGSFGVTIGTKVGGIVSQVCTGAVGIEYPDDEVSASLKMYRTLPDDLDQVTVARMRDDIMHRSSVRKVTGEVTRWLEASTEEKKAINEAARDHVLKNFATHANLKNIVAGLHMSALQAGEMPSTKDVSRAIVSHAGERSVPSFPVYN